MVKSVHISILVKKMQQVILTLALKKKLLATIAQSLQYIAHNYMDFLSSLH